MNQFPGQNYYPPYQPPQTPQFMPQQQPQPQYNQQPKVFSGRYISDINEVRLDEVPMNGVPCLFLTKDFSAIYLKVWNQNGQLLTVRYSMDQETPTQPSTPDPMNEVYERLNRLEEALTQNRARKRKESQSDGS